MKKIIEDQRVYWDTLADSVHDEVAVNHWVDESGNPIKKQMFREIAQYVERHTPGKSSTILEVGCGNSLILAELRALVGNECKLYGIDNSPGMLSRTINRKGLTLNVASADKTNFQNDSFDIIFLHGVVQYFVSEEYFLSVMKELYRVLKQGGNIILMDVPFDWYKSDIAIAKRSMLSSLKTRCRLFLEKFMPVVLNMIEKIRANPIEVVNGIKVETPRIIPYFLNPSTALKSFQNSFESIRFEVQQNEYKPTIYKKYRHNILLLKKGDF